MFTRFFYFTFFLLFISSRTNAQVNFNYKISKPYYLLHFLETATHSNTAIGKISFKSYIEEKAKGSTDFAKICERYKKIPLQITIKKNNLPVNRIQESSIFNLISMYAVSSKNLKEFKEKCIGILSVDDNQKLFDCLTEVEKSYNELIWNEFGSNLEEQAKRLSKFKSANASIFKKIKRFYNATWTDDVAFQITFFPIPSVCGYSYATPHVNSLCVGIPSDEKYFEVLNGIVLHEMCHILYDEQPVDFQHQLDGYFTQNKSLYAKSAYSFINEALATALGNGYGYKKINGQLKEGDWYAERTINAFAKKIYPLVEQYIEENKSIDQAFINQAIQIFSEEFPNAISDYSVLLTRTLIYADDITEMEMVDELSLHFQISVLNLASPILHPFSFEGIKESLDTQLFVIDKNHQEIIKKLKEFFPEIESLQFDGKPINASFIDKKGRAVIMLLLNDKKELKVELAKIKSNGFLDLKKLIQS